MNIEEDYLFQGRTKMSRLSNPKFNFPFTKIQPTSIQPTSVLPEVNSNVTAHQPSTECQRQRLYKQILQTFLKDHDTSCHITRLDGVALNESYIPKSAPLPHSITSLQFHAQPTPRGPVLPFIQTHSCNGDNI